MKSRRVYLNDDEIKKNIVGRNLFGSIAEVKEDNEPLYRVSKKLIKPSTNDKENCQLHSNINIQQAAKSQDRSKILQNFKSTLEDLNKKAKSSESTLKNMRVISSSSGVTVPKFVFCTPKKTTSLIENLNKIAEFHQMDFRNRSTISEETISKEGYSCMSSKKFKDDNNTSNTKDEFIDVNSQLIQCIPSYAEYNLSKASSISSYNGNSKRVTHPLLPYSKRNNEIYKLRLTKYLKKKEDTAYKSQGCKYFEYKKRTFEESQLIDPFNPSKFKRKKINSEKKFFESLYGFETPRLNGVKYFSVYFDRDIGFSEQWQRQLKTTEMDDDVLTDEDQLFAAGRHIARELKEGIKAFTKSNKSIRNYFYLKN